MDLHLQQGPTILSTVLIYLIMTRVSSSKKSFFFFFSSMPIRAWFELVSGIEGILEVWNFHPAGPTADESNPDTPTNQDTDPMLLQDFGRWRWNLFEGCSNIISQMGGPHTHLIMHFLLLIWNLMGDKVGSISQACVNNFEHSDFKLGIGTFLTFEINFVSRSFKETRLRGLKQNKSWGEDQLYMQGRGPKN